VSAAWRLVRAGLGAIDAERAHRLGLGAAALAGRLPGAGRPQPGDPGLAVRLWGLDFPGPVGLAAGFDKDAEAVAGLFRLGFDFVEVGTVTPRPQAGNPRPRLMRVPAAGAVINRMGFNNAGLPALVARLEALRARPAPLPGPLGANLGCNRDSADPPADYRAGVAAVAGLADYLTINISSPNTPGLRAWQERPKLAALVDAVLAARAATGRHPPVLVKIAPDLAPDALAAVCAVAVEQGADGLIVGNTTLDRPAGLPAGARAFAGGLSGRPLMAPSTRALAQAARETGGRLPLIGVGGVASGADAYAKIRAGASLVQLYTALVFEGPGVVRAIRRDLAARLAADGFASVAAAVGVDAGTADAQDRAGAAAAAGSTFSGR